MFTPITIQFLGAVSKDGGRRPVDRTQDVECVWTDVSSIGGTLGGDYKSRVLNPDVDITVELLFQSVDTTALPGNYVVNKGVLYEIVDVSNVPSDLGLDGTCTLMLKKIGDKRT